MHSIYIQYENMYPKHRWSWCLHGVLPKSITEQFSTYLVSRFTKRRWEREQQLGCLTNCNTVLPLSWYPEHWEQGSTRTHHVWPPMHYITREKAKEEAGWWRSGNPKKVKVRRGSSPRQKTSRGGRNGQPPSPLHVSAHSDGKPTSMVQPL